MGVEIPSSDYVHLEKGQDWIYRPLSMTFACWFLCIFPFSFPALINILICEFMVSVLLYKSYCNYT